MIEYIEKNILYTEEFFKKELPSIRPLRPDASFLIWLDCRGLNLNHDELTDLFVNYANVALNDGEMFGKEGKGFMRLNVATPLVKLKDILERIKVGTEDYLSKNQKG